MKTSTILIGTGLAATAAYLYWKHTQQQSAEAPIQEAQVIESKPLVSTSPVIMQKPQQPDFVPVIKNPEDPKPVRFTTVTAEPVSKPVYVAPVENPVPVYTSPVDKWATKKEIQSGLISGYSIF